LEDLKCSIIFMIDPGMVRKNPIIIPYLKHLAQFQPGNILNLKNSTPNIPVIKYTTIITISPTSYDQGMYMVPVIYFSQCIRKNPASIADAAQ
jgi:hypothetical protein